MSSGLADLARRLSRKIEQRKTIQLSPADLDQFVLSGAYDVLQAKAAEELKHLAQERIRKAAELKTPEA